MSRQSLRFLCGSYFNETTRKGKNEKVFYCIGGNAFFTEFPAGRIVRLCWLSERVWIKRAPKWLGMRLWMRQFYSFSRHARNYFQGNMQTAMRARAAVKRLGAWRIKPRAGLWLQLSDGTAPDYFFEESYRANAGILNPDSIKSLVPAQKCRQCSIWD